MNRRMKALRALATQVVAAPPMKAILVIEHERGVDCRRSRRGLTAGDVGTVVHVDADKRAYEVEFLTLTGRTAAVVTLEAAHVRPVGGREITHARELEIA